MVFWCKTCNALIGVREPITNWATDRTRLCANCVDKQGAGQATQTAVQEIEQHDQTLMDSQNETSNPLKNSPADQ